MKNFILFISLAFVFAGCGLGDASDKAEKLSDTFHNNLKARDTEALLKMIHEDAYAATPKETWRALFEKIYSTGELTNVQKSAGFNSSVNNGVHTVKLNYNLQIGPNQYYEYMVWQSSKDGNLKLLSIEYKKI